MVSLQVRNFVPPQTEDPEIYIMDQEAYTGHYGGDGTKPGSLSLARLVLFCFPKYAWFHQKFLTQQIIQLTFLWTSEAYGLCGTNSGKAAGVVWKSLPQGGPEGNQSDYPRDHPWANFQTIPKSFPLLVRIQASKIEGNGSRRSCLNIFRVSAGQSDFGF